MRIITTTAVAIAVICHRQRRRHRYFDCSRFNNGIVSAFSSSGSSIVRRRIIRFHPTTANYVGVLRVSTVDEQQEAPTQHQYKMSLQNTRSIVQLLDGLITRRRAIGKHLVFLDLLPMDLPQLPLNNNNDNEDDYNTLYYKEQIRTKKKVSNSNNEIDLTNVVQVIMRRDLWDNHNNTSSSSSSLFDMYQKIINPGVHVKLTGYSGPKDYDPMVVVFYCQKAQYTLANNDPRHLRNVLHYVIDGSLDIHHVIQALPYITLEELTNRLYEVVTRSSSMRGGEVLSDYLEKIATELLAKFPMNYLSNPSKLAGCTNIGKRKLLPFAPLVYLTVPSFGTVSSSSAVAVQNYINKEETDKEVLSIANVIAKYNQQNQLNQVLNAQSQTKQYNISGWVQNRRRYQDNITVLELVDEFTSSSSSSLSDTSNMKDGDANDTTVEWNFTPKKFCASKLSCVIHPDALIESSSSNNRSDNAADIYGNILCPGAHVKLSGYIISGTSSSSSSSSINETNKVEHPVFWTTTCQLLRSSWRPSAVRYILDLLHKGKFDINEASTALNLPYTQTLDIAQRGTNTNTIAQRCWLAAELTQGLQQGAKSRAGTVSNAMIESLQVYKYARLQYPVTTIPLEYELDWSPPSVGDESKHNSHHSSTSSEKEGSSRWQRTKKPQLKFMIDQIELVLRSHPDFGRRVLKVIDIGGGKGLLSNVLAEMFGSDIVQVQVVDTSISATTNGMIKARQRGLQNIQYLAQDATTLDISSGVDVVVALHACGALSDVALGHASVHGAAFVICPCCFLSNRHLQVVSLVDDGIVEDNTTTILIPTETWLTVDPIQYGKLKQLAEIQGDIKFASKAMHTICGLRAMAVDKFWRQSLPRTKLEISIKQFPLGFSTRNFCLVGQILQVG